MTQRHSKKLPRGSSPIVMSRSGLGAAEWQSPVWFPASARGRRLTVGGRAGKESLGRLMRAATRDGLGERVLMTGLTCAAVLGIGYGFLSLVNSM